MRCIDCPIMKYDGKNYVCPAHPYAEGFDMYTELEGCRAREWYMEYLFDRKKMLYESLSQLELNLPVLNEALETLRTRGGYGKKLFDELEIVINKYTDRQQELLSEYKKILAELDRITTKPGGDEDGKAL